MIRSSHRVWAKLDTRWQRGRVQRVSKSGFHGECVCPSELRFRVAPDAQEDGEA